MEKILTIIIPTYNMEKYLRKCLDSLIVSDENMEQLEVLVINDGSKDSSSTIAHEYESKYPETFRVIDKENGNYGSCINRGLKEATGKYVKVLDADDYLDVMVLDAFIAFLHNNEVNLVISDFNIVNEAGSCLSDYSFNLPMDRTFKLQDIPDKMNTYLWHQSVTYKREVFSMFNYKQTEGTNYTDDEWIFKPMMWVDSVVYFPKTLYLYLRGREGQTFDMKVMRRTLEQRVVVAKEMIRFFVSNIGSCRPENVSFVAEKLTRRLENVYRYHLVRYPSLENKKKIIDFDQYIKQTIPEIYEKLGYLTNNYGWCFIKQWRQMHFSSIAPFLLMIRLKFLLGTKLNRDNVVVERIPDFLKRKP